LFTQQESLWAESHYLEISEGDGGLRILFNGRLMSIRCPGFGGARIRPGTAGLHNAVGGDCVLMDFSKGLFAVADSPERQPSASQLFFVKFGKVLQAFSEFDPREIYPVERLHEIGKILKERTESLLAGIPYWESCTFTGLLIARTDGGLKGIMMHMGDSFLFQHVPGGKMTQISKTNFWMVGRSAKLYEFHVMDIPGGATLLLATDGISDLVFSKNTGRDGCLGVLMESADVDKISDKLLEGYDTGPRPVDDLGLVLFKPERFCPSKDRIILHGEFCGDISMIRLPG
jgi:hypothetical protein